MNCEKLTILCIGHNPSIDKWMVPVIEVPRVAPNLVRIERLRLINMASTPYIWFVDDDDKILSIPRNFEGDETRYSYIYKGRVVRGGTGLWSSVFNKDFLLKQNYSSYLSREERKEDFAFRKCFKPKWLSTQSQIIYHYLGSERKCSI